MKISFIATVLNEEKTIGKLLDSLLAQSKKPDEVIVVDGGSKDKTVEKIKKAKIKMQNYNLKLKILIAEGTNRAQGRNLGIRTAKNEIIAISDAGCELDKNWLKNITQAFKNSKVDVVAGYYRVRAKNIFEKCVAPFVLVMPDRVNPQNFLPASRSMAIRKKTWQKFGGFPEGFPDNEDYVFANRLKKGGAEIVFCKKAIAYWYSRSNLKDFFVMIYRFARGDAQARLRWKKVITVFLRYILGLFLLFWALNNYSILPYCYVTIMLYFLWAIWKNYRYVKHPAAFFYFPLLQISSDLAIMSGTAEGLFRFSRKNV